MGYGEMVRSIRVQRGVTLREFAIKTEIDVAYLSRVERETINPPQGEEILDSINEALGISKQEAESLKDQAAIDNKKFPDSVAEKISEIKGVPLLLRTVANKKPTEEQMREIIKTINENY